MTKRKRPRKNRRRAPRAAVQPVLPRIRAALEVLLHPQATDRPWKYLPLVLALAFAARAAVALSGDFVVHPDEIMQYLEPAHRLVFGSGVTYWEYFYGARSWLVPGTVAGVLLLFDAVGLGQPFWYIGGVKLLFCAISLAIPAGMYVFARRHFGETAGRAALLAGAFWYELIGFAHKPMTEFVATAPLVALLALCVRPSVDHARTAWMAAFLACLTAAIRLQYAPAALLLLGIVFLRTGKRIQLTLAAAGFAAAFGLFDAVVWDGGLFHSYVINIRYNLILGPMRTGESPAYQFLLWLTLAGLGLSVLCVAAALRRPRRYGFLLGLIALVLLIHSLQAHKEYRYVFAVIPLWLLIGADLAARLAARGDGTTPFCRICNRRVRRRFAGRDPECAALPGPGVPSLVQGDWSGGLRPQSGPDLPHLSLSCPRTRRHRRYGRSTVPITISRGTTTCTARYPSTTRSTGSDLKRNVEAVSSLVSHIVSADPGFSVPGYSLEQEFGEVRILRRGENQPPVRPWLDHAPVMVSNLTKRIMRRIDPDGPSPPANHGIRFADRERP